MNPHLNLNTSYDPGEHLAFWAYSTISFKLQEDERCHGSRLPFQKINTMEWKSFDVGIVVASTRKCMSFFYMTKLNQLVSRSRSRDKIWRTQMIWKQLWRKKGRTQITEFGKAMVPLRTTSEHEMLSSPSSNRLHSRRENEYQKSCLK
ncbi:hypothetical protein SAY87_026121 [Trapa incisa]|uniref:Uncharacterized protein n=1 Tax=Trapa incisa TaxID=236973 RepID=A0AAN7JJQ5_9MYRT|nr:hypothetical protein SAY87_026121 [Trapa incisa]